MLSIKEILELNKLEKNIQENQKQKEEFEKNLKELQDFINLKIENIWNK